MQHLKIPHEELTIRALSWNQPFASLMLRGKIETRKRSTKVRGLVLICSCKKEYEYGQVIDISGEQTGRITDTLQCHWSSLPLGKAIAVGELTDCRPMTEEDADKCFVAYREGLWCWVFENVRPIHPFDFKGKQGWGILDNETKQKIKYIGG